MGIVAINTAEVRSQSKDSKSKALPGVGFSEFLGVAGAVGSDTIARKGEYNTAAVTQAAISGIAAAPGAFAGNAPYYASTPTLGTNSPFSGGGYNYSGSQFNAGYNFGGGYVGAGYGAGAPATGTPGVPGAPSQDYMEKQALFTQMNDANWEMLLAQVTVNEISRDYQARSNILKTKSDTELNAVRNMRA